MFPALLSPEVLEPVGRQLGVANGMLDVLVPQIGLQRPRVMPFVGQRIAAGMAQHVRMYLDVELGRDAEPLDHAGMDRPPP